MESVSVIIPTCEDEERIIYLIRKIDEVLRWKTPFEILVIDDNSTDLTQHIVKRLEYTFPVKLRIKKGQVGKAQSLLEGVSYAVFPIIVAIDCTLEYSPETIPVMLEKIYDGFDIVVAERKQKNRLLHILGKQLHNLSIDIQSGLKVFRKEIIQRQAFNPSPLLFDLEFYVKAKNAGYTIASIPIPFEKHHRHSTLRNVIHAFLRAALHAFTLKFSRQEVIPYHTDDVEKKGQGFHYKGQAFTHFSTLTFSESAFFSLTGVQKKFITSLVICFGIGFFFNWHSTLITLFAALTFLYFADLLFNLYLIIRSFYDNPEITITKEGLLQKNTWPSYTIFCPLYKEKNILHQFIKAIENIDYPKEKLQVILLLEEDDRETTARAKNLSLPTYFSILIPPRSTPKTKPKALNFGLRHATGEYCVVYDAEDIPDPQQLKKVVIAFEKSQPEIKCIQAKLNFYNPFQNFLTRVFTAEYSLWFELILIGLQASHAVIPLGGTSNHFHTQDLRTIRGWDSFNVTEDCDLGLRLARQGYQTAIINSTTLEEANSNLFNWLLQRSRWIKGYMQTYLVHVRQPKEFIHRATIQQFFAFQLIVGGKVLSLFINPIMWCITVIYFMFRPMVGNFIDTFFPGPILYMGVSCLVFGNFLYLYYYMIGCAKRHQYGLIKFAFLVPLYWLCMSIAGLYALYKIATEPHAWDKTQHGLHLKKQMPEQKIFTIPKLNPQISI